MVAPNTNFSQVTSITRRYFLPKLYDNIFLGNPLLARSEKKGWRKLIDGGDKVIIPLEYAIGSNSDWYSGADTLNVADVDNFTAA